MEEPPFSAYRKYIIPTWLFEIYFVGMGYAFAHWTPNFLGNWVMVVFAITIGVPFFGTFFWSLKALGHISLSKLRFLTMAVPFFIFGTIVILLAVGQLVIFGPGKR